MAVLASTSWCYVLIKQSDSPCSYQFNLALLSQHCWANSFPQVTNLFCRLPLPTLILSDERLSTLETCCGHEYDSHAICPSSFQKERNLDFYDKLDSSLRSFFTLLTSVLLTALLSLKTLLQLICFRVLRSPHFISDLRGTDEIKKKRKLFKDHPFIFSKPLFHPLAKVVLPSSSSMSWLSRNLDLVPFRCTFIGV